MSQGGGLTIPPTWLLLDNQSTVDVFANGDMLKDIHQVDDEMVIASNGGSNVTSEMGTLPGYGLVWYDPVGMHCQYREPIKSEREIPRLIQQ
jgi:hypothetical protein